MTAHLAVGDRVTVETDAYRCGNCEYCLKGEYNRCPYRLGIGTTVDGGLADQLVMPAETVHKLPEGLSMAAGSLSEPLAVAVHAVIEQSPSLAGEVVVVIGPGAIGLLCAQVARAVGATVVLVGRSRHADRLELARRLGVDRTVDSRDRGRRGGRPVDDRRLRRAQRVRVQRRRAAVLEGVAPLLRKGGRIVLVAFFHEQPSVDIDKLINNELELVGSRGKRASSFHTALRLVESGHIDLEPVIGARLPLDEWEKGIELVAQGVKVVLEVRPEP